MGNLGKSFIQYSKGTKWDPRLTLRAPVLNGMQYYELTVVNNYIYLNDLTPHNEICDLDIIETSLVLYWLFLIVKESEAV